MKRNLFAAVAVSMILASPTHAANIIDEWASVKTPKAPELKAVTVDPKTTALLVLDFMNQNCGQRPRCLETIPAMKKLLAEARAHKVPVVYSIMPTALRPMSSRMWRRWQRSRMCSRAPTNSAILT